MDQTSVERGIKSLFLPDFDKTAENQKHHVLNCLKECYIINAKGERKHFLELNNNNEFLLLRSTGGTCEAFHMSLNRVVKKRVGEHLSKMIMQGISDVCMLLLNILITYIN